jgi:hypothetical protein
MARTVPVKYALGSFQPYPISDLVQLSPLETDKGSVQRADLWPSSVVALLQVESVALGARLCLGTLFLNKLNTFSLKMRSKKGI